MSHQHQLSKWIGLIGLSLMASISFLDVTIVFPALPVIQQDFSTSVLTLQWVINIFGIPLASFILLAGKLGDVYGKRKLFYIGVFLFGLASIGAGTSVNFNWLIVFRAIQGTAAAMIFNNGAALAPTAFTLKEHPKAIGIYTAITGLGLGIGPFIGGLLVHYFSWRFIFFLNVPLIIIGFLLCFNNITETPSQPQMRVDWLGALLLVAGLGLYTYSIIQVGHFGWVSSQFIMGIVIATALLITLWFYEKRISNPLLDLEDINKPQVLLGFTICGCSGITSMAIMFFIPLFLSNILNISAIAIGFILLCTPAVQVIMSVFWNSLINRFGFYTLLVCCIATACLSAFIQSFFGISTPMVIIISALLLLGFIWGAGNMSAVALAYMAVPAERTGATIGMIFTGWSAIGSAVLAIASTFFSTIEFQRMAIDLQKHHISLSKAQHTLISSALSDPNQAKVLLSHFSGAFSSKILPLFKDAFLAGYHGVMLLTALLFALALVIALMFIQKIKLSTAEKPDLQS